MTGETPHIPKNPGMTSRPPYPYPRVGVGVFIFDNEGNFIVGQRLGSHGSGTLSLPGGHLELHESFIECAARETLEETGLEIQEIQFLTAVNNVFPEGQHYVTIFMGSRKVDENKEFQVLEPEKCGYWKWTSPSDLLIPDRPEVFQPLKHLLQKGVGDGNSEASTGLSFDAWEIYKGLMSGVEKM